MVGKKFQVSIHLIGILLNQSWVANTIKETVSLSCLVVTRFIRAYVAMMSWLIIQLIGMTKLWITFYLCPFEFVGLFSFSSLHVYITYAGELLQRWCAWNAWLYSQLEKHAQLSPVIIYRWEDTIAGSANCLMMKGDASLQTWTFLKLTIIYLVELVIFKQW